MFRPARTSIFRSVQNPCFDRAKISLVHLRYGGQSAEWTNCLESVDETTYFLLRLAGHQELDWFVVSSSRGKLIVSTALTGGQVRHKQIRSSVGGVAIAAPLHR